MKRLLPRALAFIGVVALTSCSGGSMGGSAIPAGPGAPVASNEAVPTDMPSGDDAPNVSPAAEPAPPKAAIAVPDNGEIPFRTRNAVQPVCRTFSPHGFRCFAWLRTDLAGMNGATGPYGFHPADLQSAYRAPSDKGGKGQTIGIVDAYGYTSAAGDLAKYRSYFHLPACTIANKCLRIANDEGGSSLPAPNPGAGWDIEQALDLDMVSAMCPNCKIVLFQASADTGLYTSNATAAKMGINVVNNSYGSQEFEHSDTQFFPAGTTYVASAGDYGGGTLPAKYSGPQQPCTLSNFVCVGGTHLKKASAGRGWTETVWNDETTNQCGSNGTSPCGATGSACSKLVARPSWQSTKECAGRAAADASAVASVWTPVSVFHDGKWIAVAGTSASTPIIAAMIALAGNGKTANVPQLIWARGKTAFNDVVAGNNIYGPVTGKCSSSVHFICAASKGYDGPTGWGTPKGTSGL